MQRNRISLFVHPFILTSVFFSAAAFAELLDTTLPADFPAIKNDYLGVPVIGFGSRGRVDIVAHSLGVTATREWLLQDNAYHLVRSLVAIDGPNHGIIDCSPSPANYFQLPANGGFVPSSAICEEYGSDHTQLLTVLNGAGETPGPTRYLVIRNVYRTTPLSGDFVFFSAQDGHLPAVPAQDRDGNAHDFSNSAVLAGAPSIDLVGQRQYDLVLGTSHLGIVNSPQTWQSALEFLSKRPGAQ